MAKHEFGIMQTPPKPQTRYDEYEPEKYQCISIDDEYVEKIEKELIDIDFYWHTLDVSGKGLAYCGITLMPPESLDGVINVIDKYKDLSELKALLVNAKEQSKYVIHYGL